MTREMNNFDGVRIGLALIVLFAHTGALVQIPEFSWFSSVFDSDFAVKGFFAISGFLVTKSYLASENVFDYYGRRLRRIWPAYIVAILFCLSLGACLTTLDPLEFVSNIDSAKYLFSNLVFLNFVQPTLPGVFEGNPIRAMNGALWTIKVEMMLYFCVPFLVICWRTNHAIIYGFLIIFFSVLWAFYFAYFFSGSYGVEIARQFPGQLSYFTLGSLLSAKDRIRSSAKYLLLPLLLLNFLLENHVLRGLNEPFLYSVLVIWLCSSKIQLFNFGKYGDISYGIYLFHFPVIQALVFFGLFKRFPWFGLIVTIIVTMICSFVSWHYIEKKFIRRSSYYVQAQL